MKEIPQLGSRGLSIWFAVFYTAAVAAAAVLYCAAAAALQKAGLGRGAYVAALAVPVLIGAGVTALFSAPVNRRFQQMREAFQAVIDGDLSVQLPQTGNGIFSAAYADFNRMVRELEKVRAMRDEYVNTFTHEFKTPLTAIRGFAELLQQPGFTEAEQKRYLQIIASESSQLAELANDALLLTKLETQNLPVVKRRFWLDEQVSRSLALLETGAREKGQFLTAEIEPVEICGSEELLAHVWTNLIGNAIKYTPEGGRVSVTLRQQGGQVVFTVADNGIGMTREVRSHIFDRYYQADPSHTRRGIGLGLPIVHRILELCGGEISVESQPGQGSVFRVCLPRGMEENHSQ